jgi:hypothetical protein
MAKVTHNENEATIIVRELDTILVCLKGGQSSDAAYRDLAGRTIPRSGYLIPDIFLQVVYNNLSPVALVPVQRKLQPNNFFSIMTNGGTARRSLLAGRQMLGLFAALEWYYIDILTSVNGFGNRVVLGGVGDVSA